MLLFERRGCFDFIEDSVNLNEFHTLAKLLFRIVAMSSSRVKVRVGFLVGALVFSLATISGDGASLANVSVKGTVVGQVLLGPICPVERIPPDPACSPKPYRATIAILRATAVTPYKKIVTSALGKFAISLPPGDYILRISSSTQFPRCGDETIKVIARRTLRVKMDCDTGIR